MDTTKQSKGSRLSFPVGTWENAINLDRDDHRSRTKTFKSTSTYGKTLGRVRTRNAAGLHMRLTNYRSEDIIIQSGLGL